MEAIILGIITALNIIVVLWKIRHHRILDGILDGGALILVTKVFAGGVASLTIGAIGSFIVSLYLLLFPPKLPVKFKKKQHTKMKFYEPQLNIYW